MGRHSLAFLALLVCAGCARDGSTWSNLWSSPEQQAQWWLDREDYEAAAALSNEALRRGFALYRARRFEEAEAAFGRGASSAAAFNRGNSLVMLGRYEEAMASYDRALELEPSWSAAVENRELARLRLARLARPEDDAGGTGGQLGADEIVFDGADGASSSETTMEVGAGDPLSDEELRTLWLRRVETRPRDFLRVKFAQQYSRRSREGER